MIHNTPQVIIDLEEYNELLKIKKNSEETKESFNKRIENVLKKTLLEIFIRDQNSTPSPFSSKTTLQKVHELFESNGLEYRVSSDYQIEIVERSK